MRKKIKKKVTKRQLREVFSEAQQRQIRLDSANQIFAACAEVLTKHFDFDPDQCVKFARLVGDQIRINRGMAAAEETAVAEEGESDG